MGPKSITNAEELEASGLLEGDPFHLAVIGTGGQWTNNPLFVGRLVKGNLVMGIKYTLHGKNEETVWEDIMEFWPLPSSLCLAGPQKETRVREFQERVYGKPENH